MRSAERMAESALAISVFPTPAGPSTRSGFSRTWARWSEVAMAGSATYASRESCSRISATGAITGGGSNHAAVQDVKRRRPSARPPRRQSRLSRGRDQNVTVIKSRFAQIGLDAAPGGAMQGTVWLVLDLDAKKRGTMEDQLVALAQRLRAEGIRLAMVFARPPAPFP